MPRAQTVFSTSSATSSIAPLENTPFFVIVGILLGATMLKFLWFGDYLSSSLLFQDDTIFLGHYHFGVSIKSPPTQAFYYGLVELVTSTAGIFGAKVLLLWVQAGISVFAYLIINEFARAKFVALGLSVALMHYPVAVDQNFFVIGAHPQFGILALFSSIYCLLKGPVLAANVFSRKSLILTLLASAFVVVGSRSSPTLMLMPILFLVALGFLLLEDGFRSQFNFRHLCAGSILSVVSGVLAFNRSSYHYSSVQGWVDVSGPQILENLVAALSSILKVPFEERVWFLLICVVGLVLFLMLAAVALREHAAIAPRDWTGNRKLLFLGFLVICAACLFGPGAVATSYLGRYVIAPYSVMALVIGCFIGWAFKTSSPRIGRLHKFLAFIMNGVLSVAVIWTAGITTRDALFPYQEAHAATLSAIEPFSFDDDDQIVVLLPESVSSPTSGFNHWSTWYLRVLTRNGSIIGLVGTQSMYDPKLGAVFVDKYKDHDPSYWAVRDGRSFRLQLVGLEKDRRLFAFLADVNGELKPASTVASDKKGEVRIVQFGEAFLQGSGVPSAFDQMCETAPAEPEHIVRFTHDQSLDIGQAILEETANTPVARRVELLSDAFEASGEVEQRVNADLTLGELAQIELLFNPKSYDAGPGAYSDVFPPMPVLSSTVAIYHIDDKLRITTREEPSQSFNVHLMEDEGIELKIVGCVGGQAAILVGDEIIGSTSFFAPKGEWVLGKGFLRRYWQGDFRSFIVTHYLATANE